MISESTGDIAMMLSPNRKVDAAIVSLLCLLPLELTELWWNTDDLSAFLRRGGVTGITAERLRRALERSQRFTGATQWKCRRWINTHYYLLGKALEDFTPKKEAKDECNDCR